MRLPAFLTYHRRDAGFTLIELLVVLAIMGMIIAISVPSVLSFQRDKTFLEAVSDFANTLTQAKSAALSQVKPSGCGANILTAYQIVVDSSTSQYILQAICAPDIETIETNTLPTNITFSADATFTFPVLSTSTAAESVTLSGYGFSRTVQINSVGALIM